MKVSTLAAMATTSVVVLASPYRHNHAHLHDIHKRTQTETTYVAGSTAYAFEIDGRSLSVDEVCEGIKDETMKFEGQAPAGLCERDVAAPSNSAGAFYQASASANATAAAATSAAAAPSGSGGWNSWHSVSQNATGIDVDFPDGQLDCSEFPSQYGAVPVEHLGMGGYIGIQKATFGVNAITDIVTGISGETCSGFCSYACPPGYQKSQWPQMQGSTGQSVGGLQCKNGKLYLTNPGLSSKLCIPGVGGVQAKNNAAGVVAICRTDYPGTESETVPISIAPGETQPLANPDAATYYQHEGASTSAQYYLNPIGVTTQQGCQWGSKGTDMGNFAPINLGVGHKDGTTWLSIFQNQPTTYSLYQGTVELQGDLSAKCTYSNGQYCGATGCNAIGCTVAVKSGTATFVVSQ